MIYSTLYLSTTISYMPVFATAHPKQMLAELRKSSCHKPQPSCKATLFVSSRGLSDCNLSEPLNPSSPVACFVRRKWV